MKLLALLVLCAVAARAAEVSFAGATSGIASLGYPNRAASAKGGGDNIWGAFPVDSRIRPPVTPGDGNYVCFMVMAQVTDANALTISGASFYALPYMTGTTPTDPVLTAGTSIPLANLQITKGQQSDFDIVDVTPQSNSSAGYNWFGGISVGAMAGSCTGCVSTADWQVSAMIGYSEFTCSKTSPQDVSWSPVIAVDSSNSWTFGASVGSFQAQPAAFMLDPNLMMTPALPIFALLTPSASNGAMHVVFQTQLIIDVPSDANIVPASANPPSGQTFGQQNSMVGPLVSPLGTATTSMFPFRTGPISLTAATGGNAWFVFPYVDAGTTWTLAIGYGHQPSAAMAVAPSLLLAAIFAVVAMLL